MMCPNDPWRRFEADCPAGRNDEYRREKAKAAERLIERAEAALIPRLRSMIEVVEAATRLTNLRHAGNPDGAIRAAASIR